jgi:GMP synthase-like glutamine amidotransferase
MRVLAFRHVPFEHLGLIGDALERCGVAYDYADPFRDETPAEAAAEYDGLISMGGPMSANDGLPGLRREMRAIEAAAARGKPVLGVCLGAQLIARALGARVYRNPVKEIGWFEMSFTGAARRDPLFRNIPGPETVFHWHGETFDLPPGAELLASSRACHHQAFRAGRTVWGVQFHLEVTPDMIEDWCRQDANCGDMREIPEPIDARAHAGRLGDLAATVFDRWCALLPGA